MMDHADIDDRPNVDHAMGQAARADQDQFGKRGMLVVGLAAAVLSFQIWVQLAQAVGFTAHWSISVFGLSLAFWIAWLYPVAIDVYALLVTREWLRSAPGSRLRKWAKTNSIGAIGLSFLGQGAFHAFAGDQPPAWFVIAMGGMPPLIVGLTVHLYTMRGQVEESEPVQVRQADQLRSSAAPKPVRKQPTTVDDPVQTADDPVQSPRSKTNANGGRSTKRSGPAVQMVWSPTIRAMADHLDRHYRDQNGRPIEIPARRKVQAAMEVNPGGMKWSSAGQVDQAIKAARSIRESGSDAEERAS